MKKSEIYEVVSASIVAVNALVAGTKLEGPVADELAKIDAITKPGVGGGAKVDPAEVSVKDAEGNITHLLCSLSKRWVAIKDDEGNDNFYLDAKSDTFGGYKRLSKAAESIRQKSAKAIKATEAAVLADLLNPEVELNEADAQAKIAESKVVDYSTVGSEDRPE